MVSLHIVSRSAAAIKILSSIERMVGGLIGSAGQYYLYFLASPGLKRYFWESSVNSLFSLMYFKATSELSEICYSSLVLGIWQFDDLFSLTG